MLSIDLVRLLSGQLNTKKEEAENPRVMKYYVKRIFRWWDKVRFFLSYSTKKVVLGGWWGGSKVTRSEIPFAPPHTQ